MIATLNSTTPLSDIKTVDNLLQVLTAAGWKQAPTIEVINPPGRPDWKPTTGRLWTETELPKGPSWQFRQTSAYCEKPGFQSYELLLHPVLDWPHEHVHGFDYVVLSFLESDKEFYKARIWDSITSLTEELVLAEVCVKDLKSLLEEFQEAKEYDE